MGSETVVLDASSAVNLLATGREVELVRAVDWSLIIVAAARAEVCLLRGPPGVDGRAAQVPVDWRPLEAAELIQVCSLGDEGLDAFVAAAARLTDVDAQSIALAAVRRLPLLTDDGKMRTVFRALHPTLRLYSTLQLLKRATEALRLGRASVREILQRVRSRANFAPPRSDPERQWYGRVLADDSR